MSKRKIVVAVTGASGALYARLLLKRLFTLREQLQEVGVIFSANATEIWKYEAGESFNAVPPFKIYERNDFYAPFASGSSSFDTLIVCPCSAGILGRIAGGISDDLITRAADVMLKERRRLILVPRETPFNLIHIENMKTITLAGGVICPAIPSFYSRPQTLEEAAMTVIDRVLTLAGFHHDGFRWNE
jgi:4-hydroxy-3-polyprenylbenzoate decarboxylase